MSIFRKKNTEPEKLRTIGEQLVGLIELQSIGTSFEVVSERMKGLVKKEKHDKVERLLGALGYHCFAPGDKDMALQKNLYELKKLKRDKRDGLNVSDDFRKNLCRYVETGKW